MEYVSRGVTFVCNIDIDESEADNYIQRAVDSYHDRIFARVEGDHVDVRYSESNPFIRIRRQYAWSI